MRVHAGTPRRAGKGRDAQPHARETWRVAEAEMEKGDTGGREGREDMGRGERLREPIEGKVVCVRVCVYVCEYMFCIYIDRQTETKRGGRLAR